MALLSREFIAVPDDKKNQIVFKWPDLKIRKFTRAIVNADELALFINTGQVVGTMGPGRHQIDAQELPFLGMFIDAATGGNAYRAELYFVGTREYPGFTFGGRIDDVQDPQTGMIVTLRVFGDYSLQVKDPAALITNLVGTVDVTNNERVAGWVSDQLLKVMRTEVTTQIVRNGWPILGLSAYTPGPRKGVHRGRQQPAGDLRRGPGPYGQLRRQLLARPTKPSSRPWPRTPHTAAWPVASTNMRRARWRSEPGRVWPRAARATPAPSGCRPGAWRPARRAASAVRASLASPAPSPPSAGVRRRRRRLCPGAAGPCGASGAGAAATVTVPDCQSTQPAGAKFCASCGAAMPPPPGHCAACGADNAAGGTVLRPVAATPGASAPPSALMRDGGGAGPAVLCQSCGTAVAPPAAAAAAASPPAPPAPSPGS